MAQVQTTLEKELLQNTDGNVVDDEYVEPNYFALSNFGQFIENQLAKVV
jgi:hypothetical protein